MATNSVTLLVVYKSDLISPILEPPSPLHYLTALLLSVRAILKVGQAQVVQVVELRVKHPRQDDNEYYYIKKSYVLIGVGAVLVLGVLIVILLWCKAKSKMVKKSEKVTVEKLTVFPKNEDTRFE